MEQRQILELALEALEKQKADLNAALAEIREMQDGNKRIISSRPEIPTLVVVKRRSKTLAERRAHSQKMRKYWAAKKAQAAKPASAVKKPAPVGAKVGTKTDAKRKALSLAMKKAWKKRKAAAAAKTAKTK
jgi:hypothetical protein